MTLSVTRSTLWCSAASYPAAPYCFGYFFLPLALLGACVKTEPASRLAGGGAEGFRRTFPASDASRLLDFSFLDMSVLLGNEGCRNRGRRSQPAVYRIKLPR